MTSPTWAHDDDELLAMIKAAAADTSAMTADPTAASPGSDGDVLLDRMRRAAKAALTWRTIDQELDRLTMSSDSELLAAAAVRGAGTAPSRIVEFHGDSFDLELEIGDESLIGQVYPAQLGQVTLLTAAGLSIPTPVDDVGCFLFDRPAAGPFRLRCDIGDGGLGVVTEWITLT